MDIIQTFYDQMASHYDKLFLDWHASTRRHAKVLDQIFRSEGYGPSSRILDCACGIGTQSIGLASLGYAMTASDISDAALAEAQKRAVSQQLNIRFAHADFCALSDTFTESFDLIIAMDNALPHMLSSSALELAVKSIAHQITPGGMFVASIRDYDALLEQKPPYSPPYIHPTEKGQRVSFQTWEWKDDSYKLIQYIIEDEQTLQIHKFECAYRATRREELSSLLLANGFSSAEWRFPEETGF